TFTIARNAIPRTGGHDKDFVGVDSGPLSPHQGTIYVAYSVFVRRGIEIEVVTSRDGGATWSRPVVLAGVAPRESFFSVGRFGALPVIASDGTAFIFWSEFPELTLSGPTQVRFSKSTDGGVTWTP